GCGSGSSPHGVAVPNVIGTTAARATQELEGAGLRVATRVRWNGDPVAHVLAQEPATGPAKRNQTISLVVSARGRLVPSVVGQPVGTAVAALRRRGFAVAGGRHSGVVAAQRPTPTWSR